LVLGSGTWKADRPACLSRNIYRFLRPLGFGYIHQGADNLLSSGFKLCAVRPKTDVLDLPIGHHQTLFEIQTLCTLSGPLDLPDEPDRRSFRMEENLKPYSRASALLAEQRCCRGDIATTANTDDSDTRSINAKRGEIFSYILRGDW
jgi:hypothetical protein